jgi:protein farnesyltransferase subunit beta
VCGGFAPHDWPTDGEVDMRGVYCAAVIASICQLPRQDELFAHTDAWVLSCQHYDGGLGGLPGMESHGGYAYCGFAAMCILGHESVLDQRRMMRWAVSRQMRHEGGFQGRVNKLVDACYSFWMGALVDLLDRTANSSRSPPQPHVLHSPALQSYILLACQDNRGGLIDKPGKCVQRHGSHVLTLTIVHRGRDLYHTCYALSGLSVAQHSSAPPMVFGNQRMNGLVRIH